MRLLQIIFKILIFFLCILQFFYCKPKAENTNTVEDILKSVGFSFWDEFNHELYKFIPISSIVSKNDFIIDQFTIANPDLKVNKPKVILIHGWDFEERNFELPTTKAKKVANIRKIWGDALEMYSQNLFETQTTYEFYTFTYRTSDYVEHNGRRLIDKLNSVFTPDDKIILLAHSMGGLVARSALYHPNNTNDVIDFIVSLGTPYLGSPFASPSYRKHLGALGELIGFVTGTAGGKDLAYTNALGTSYQVPESEIIPDASNAYLERLLSESSKDSKVTAFYGEMSQCKGHPGSGTAFIIGCDILKDEVPSFAGKNDGIVTSTSGKMSSKLPPERQFVKDLDHYQLSFSSHASVDSRNTYFGEVIAIIDSL
ncbi:esterase/lipase family protein [Leptospira interrogans]|uniref:PGAP1-like protein n=1 Tax=Leptospira interrogans str. UI 12758 TaxID=1049938 RepID=A0A0E2D4C4_LEPIR|nr:alpha/beta hydrolase [Leptospira interrogans]EKR54850.1 PGAP1-like protein [Leptospira interrogans str. UI 12758]